jgi:hypothetical protein
MDLDELVEHWTLLDDERELAAGKRGPTRLGFALLLKFYAGAGRFPRGGRSWPTTRWSSSPGSPASPPPTLVSMSGPGTRSSTTGRRSAATSGSGSAAPRTAASSPTGWPPASARPSAALTGSAGELLARCRAERIEPPSAGRCDRIIRSALHQAEQALTLRVTARLGPDASARLAELAAAAGNDEADNGEPSALSLIKSVPGNVSLESMLTEIAKLDAVRAAGLPDAAKASSQRPQATLVTQPKIAAPCGDGPGDTAERPFGFGRDGQPADPGVAPDRGGYLKSSLSTPHLTGTSAA